ncbi:acyltransferase [Streptococcus porcinus]
MYWFLRLQIQRPLFQFVGRKSYLGPEISIVGHKNIGIGNQVRIYPGSRLETHNDGHIIFGNGCTIGQNAHIISNSEPLLIGKNTTISGNVFITNVNHGYREIDRHIMDQELINRHTEIGENCFIGYGAVIQAGTVLGKQCIVGSNSVVSGEFPDYSVIVGMPAKVIKSYNPLTKEWIKVTNKS